MAEWLILLSWLALFPLLMGIVSYRGAAWCLERRNAAGCPTLLLAAAAIGTGYGLLRLSGLLRLPGDNTWSVNFFDASWRDDGVQLLVLFTGPLGGGAAALISRRRRRAESELNGKGSDGNGFS